MALMPAGILVRRTSLPGAEFADHPAHDLAQLRGGPQRLLPGHVAARPAGRQILAPHLRRRRLADLLTLTLALKLAEFKHLECEVLVDRHPAETIVGVAVADRLPVHGEQSPGADLDVEVQSWALWWCRGRRGWSVGRRTNA